MWSEFFFMITDTVDLHIHVYTVIYIFMFTQMKNIKLVLHSVKYTKIILLYSFENPQDRQFPPIRNIITRHQSTKSSKKLNSNHTMQ